MNALRRTRKKTGLTQVQAARLIGVSRRTYQIYEEKGKINDMYDEVLARLKEKGLNEKGPTLLTIKSIKRTCSAIFAKHKEVRCAYLFGSYAREEATINSDVDLLVVSDTMGLKFYGLASELEEALGKSVDLLTHRQLENNEAFLVRFLEEGVRIYGQRSNKITSRVNSHSHQFD